MCLVLLRIFLYLYQNRESLLVLKFSLLTGTPDFTTGLVWWYNQSAPGFGCTEDRCF